MEEPYRSAFDINTSLSEATDFGQIKSKLPTGVVLGVGRLVDCLPVEKALKHRNMTFTEQHFGDYSTGRFAWLIEDMKPLESPDPAKGKLGLWEWNTKD